jgi:hypothetical protein
MRILATAIVLAAALTAQSPLVTSYAGITTVPGTPPDPQVYFNLTVNTPVTLQAFDINTSSPVGTVGSVSVYITAAGGTYVGNMLNQGLWTLAASGSCTSAGLGFPTQACITPGIQLTPGTYGVAVRYNGLQVRLNNGANNYSNPDLAIQTGAVQVTPFTSTPFNNYSFSGGIHYALGFQPHSCASATPYGTGCYRIPASWYDRIATAPAAAAALNGRSISMLPNGNGYTVLQSTVAYIQPSATAQALPRNDDGESPVTLTTPFPYPGGTASVLHVCTNGFVSTGANIALPLGNNWTPLANVFLAATHTAWWSWHEYSTLETGSGEIKFEEVGPLAIITWDGVESYPLTVTNPCWFQFQFNTTTGEVHFVWQTIEAIGGNTNNDAHLVGYSPGGPSLPPVETDVTTLVGQSLPGVDIERLTLTASPRPAFGNTVQLTTTNEIGTGIGVNFLSLGEIPAPGFDLGIIGAGGCAALIDVNTAVGNVISNLPGQSMTIQFPMPVGQPSLSGFTCYSQSIWLSPTSNPAGLITSNAVKLVVGYF